MILIPFYLIFIGKELYGIWIALASTVGLLGLLDFGMNSLVWQGLSFLLICLFQTVEEFIVPFFGFRIALHGINETPRLIIETGGSPACGFK